MKSYFLLTGIAASVLIGAAAVGYKIYTTGYAAGYTAGHVEAVETQQQLCAARVKEVTDGFTTFIQVDHTADTATSAELIDRMRDNGWVK